MNARQHLLNGASRPAVVGCGVALTVLVGWLAPPRSLVLVTTGVALAIAVLGVNLVTGFTGRVALGHGAFVGLGAYVTVILSADRGWPILAALPAAAVAGFVLGVVIGIPSLRIRGLHLALVTLAVGASFGPVVKRLETVTGGSNGKGSSASWVAPTWLGEGRAADVRWWFAIVSVVALLAFAVVANIVRSRTGRAVIALRDDELAARVNGVEVARTTVTALGLSAALAAVAGCLLMLRQPFASTTNYESGFSLQLYAAATFGGLRTVRGAWFGATAMVGLPLLVRRLGFAVDDSIVFGALLVLTLAVRPNGLAGGWRRDRPPLL